MSQYSEHIERLVVDYTPDGGELEAFFSDFLNEYQRHIAALASDMVLDLASCSMLKIVLDGKETTFSGKLFTPEIAGVIGSISKSANIEVFYRYSGWDLADAAASDSIAQYLETADGSGLQYLQFTCFSSDGANFSATRRYGLFDGKLYRGENFGAQLQPGQVPPGCKWETIGPRPVNIFELAKNDNTPRILELCREIEKFSVYPEDNSCEISDTLEYYIDNLEFESSASLLKCMALLEELQSLVAAAPGMDGDSDGMIFFSAMEVSGAVEPYTMTWDISPAGEVKTLLNVGFC